jgi:hypothetical protein
MLRHINLKDLKEIVLSDASAYKVTILVKWLRPKKISTVDATGVIESLYMSIFFFIKFISGGTAVDSGR